MVNLKTVFTLSAKCGLISVQQDFNKCLVKDGANKQGNSGASQGGVDGILPSANRQ